MLPMGVAVAATCSKQLAGGVEEHRQADCTAEQQGDVGWRGAGHGQAQQLKGGAAPRAAGGLGLQAAWLDRRVFTSPSKGRPLRGGAGGEGKRCRAQGRWRVARDGGCCGVHVAACAAAAGRDGGLELQAGWACCGVPRWRLDLCDAEGRGGGRCNSSSNQMD